MFGLFLKLALALAALFPITLFNTGTEGNDGDQASQEGDTGTPEPDKSGAKFTQEDIDRIAGDARKEGRTKAIKDLLSELGFEKADDLKSLIADARKRQEAELSEVDKAKKEAEVETKRREALEAELNQVRAEQRQDRLERAVEVALQAANAKRPKDVLDLMKVRGKLDGLLTDEGQVNDKAVTAAIADFKKDNAEYFGSFAPGSPSNAGAKPPSPSEKDLEAARQQLKQHTRRF